MTWLQRKELRENVGQSEKSMWCLEIIVIFIVFFLNYIFFFYCDVHLLDIKNNTINILNFFRYVCSLLIVHLSSYIINNSKQTTQ